MKKENGIQDLVPAAEVCAKFGVVEMTLRRWLNDPRVDFPRPIRINRRRYWRLADLNMFIERRAQRDTNTGKDGGDA
ncbi:hypothetical protein B6V73_00055 [Thioclava sp. JM3]|uniref:transcriptional regulator n=1 Tax=Thioclava sp. JM3 TaxID=1973004 RepID=UPI000B53B6AE|nr:transcriptional regulator [Thioclava sp. JM3]OWY18248.1 hypothetical protein B6V73_00055 [Thioclava sp. JM3]